MTTTVANDLIVGGQALLTIQWSDPTSTTPPVDPSTGKAIVSPSIVTLTVRKPDGTEVPVGVSASGTVYSGRVALDQPGVWWYGWTASGTFAGYVEGTFTVGQRRVT